MYALGCALAATAEARWRPKGIEDGGWMTQNPRGVARRHREWGAQWGPLCGSQKIRSFGEL